MASHVGTRDAVATDSLPAGPPDTPWYRRAGTVAAAVVVLVGITGSAVVAGRTTAESGRGPAAPADERAEPDSVPAAVAPQPVQVEADDTVQGRAGSDVPVAGETFVLGDQVGKVLQDAQDDVQAASGNPFFFTFSKDATGASRLQVVDSEWRVCSQTPAAGSRADADTVITFQVVRVRESCP